MLTLFIINIIALIIGIIGMPYGYYFILRTLICITLGKYLFDTYEKQSEFDGFMYFILGIAILYNPIFPMPLGKALWTIVNLITIAVFAYLIFKEKNDF